MLSKDKESLRVVLKLNQWNQLDQGREVAVDSINSKYAPLQLYYN